MDFAKFTEKVLGRLFRYTTSLMWPVCSGLLLGLGSILPEFGFFVWFGLVPLFIFLNSKEVSVRRAFKGGYLAGLIFLSHVFAWSFDAWPLNWLGIDNKILALFLVIFLWMILIGFLALFFGFFSLAYRQCRRKGIAMLLAAPALWIVFEYARSWGLGILLAGKESLLGPHWTFGNLAYLLAQNQSARWLASYGGIYLISFLVVLINVLFFLYFKKSKKIVFSIAILILLSYFLPIGTNTREGVFTKVAVLQTNFPSVLRLDRETELARFQLQRNLIQGIEDVDILVLPENANFLSQPAARDTLNQLTDQEFFVVDSEKTVAILYDIKKGSVDHYQKMLLVPYGDYFPYFLEWSGNLINEGWVERIKEKRGRQKGEVLSRQGILFCSEAISPLLYRQTRQQGADILFNLGSLAFARGSKILDSQTQAMLQMRAAENGAYLIRSTNFGTSYIIDRTGKIIKKTSNTENQILLGEIVQNQQKTLYTEYGDWILAAALLGLTFSAIYIIMKQE